MLHLGLATPASRGRYLGPWFFGRLASAAVRRAFLVLWRRWWCWCSRVPHSINRELAEAREAVTKRFSLTVDQRVLSRAAFALSAQWQIDVDLDQCGPVVEPISFD
jgi:hypothetical protein